VGCQLCDDQCKIEKTNWFEQKTGVERPQTARSEQNYTHVTELICSQEGNTGSSRRPREIINLIGYLSAQAAARRCHGHKHVIANVFYHCIKMLLGSFGYIVIFFV